MISWAKFLIEVKKLNTQQLAEFEKFKKPPIVPGAPGAPVTPDFDKQIEYLKKMLKIGEPIARPDNVGFKAVSNLTWDFVKCAKNAIATEHIFGTNSELEQAFGSEKNLTYAIEEVSNVFISKNTECLTAATNILSRQLNDALINSAGNRLIKELGTRHQAITELVRSETAKEYVFMIQDPPPVFLDATNMQTGILYLNRNSRNDKLECSFLNSAGEKKTIVDPVPGLILPGKLTEDIVKKHFNQIANCAKDEGAPTLSSSPAINSSPPPSQAALLSDMQKKYTAWQKAETEKNGVYTPESWGSQIFWTKEAVDGLKSAYETSFNTYQKDIGTQKYLLQQHAYREYQNYSSELAGLDVHVDSELKKLESEYNKHYIKDPKDVNDLHEMKTLLTKMEKIVHDADKQRSELTKNIIAARKLSLSAGLEAADAADLSSALVDYSQVTSGDDLTAQAQTKASQVYVTLDASYEWHIMDNKTSDQDLSDKNALNVAEKKSEVSLGTNQSVSAAVSSGKTVVGILRDVNNNEVATIAMSAYPNGASVKVTPVNSELTAQQAYAAVSMLLERALRKGESPIKITTTDKYKKSMYTKALNDLLPVYFPEEKTRPTIMGEAYMNWSAKGLPKEELKEFKKTIVQTRENQLILKAESAKATGADNAVNLALQMARGGFGGPKP